METKNVLIAVILSTIILIVWATFFEPPPTKQISEAQTTKEQKTSTPSIETVETEKKISRSFKTSRRIKI